MTKPNLKKNFKIVKVIISLKILANKDLQRLYLEKGRSFSKCPRNKQTITYKKNINSILKVFFFLKKEWNSLFILEITFITSLKKGNFTCKVTHCTFFLIVLKVSHALMFLDFY